MKRLLLEWVASGVQTHYMVELMVSYVPRLVTQADQNLCHVTEKCKFRCFSLKMNRIKSISICSGDHVECVSIDYDPKKISYKELLNLFWNNHEYGLTTRVKRQYMSLILYHSEEQHQIAMRSIEEERINRAPEKIITELAAAGPFYPAEE